MIVRCLAWAVALAVLVGVVKLAAAFTNPWGAQNVFAASEAVKRGSKEVPK